MVLLKKKCFKSKKIYIELLILLEQKKKARIKWQKTTKAHSASKEIIMYQSDE